MLRVVDLPIHRYKRKRLGKRTPVPPHIVSSNSTCFRIRPPPSSHFLVGKRVHFGTSRNACNNDVIHIRPITVTHMLS